MKKSISGITLLLIIITLAACSTTGKSAGIGGVLGAGAGAIIGYATTGKASGALAGAAIGAAAGGISGYLVGKYREKQSKSSDQVYQENPAYTTQDAKDEPPVVKNLQPYITNSQGNKVNVIKGGEHIEMAMTYDILIPQYSENQTVTVEECNTLINPEGGEMDRSQLTRVKDRQVGGTDAGITVTLPENLPAGEYTHLAMVKINGQEYQAKQTLQIARTNGEFIIYARAE